jgi:protein-L-isoaspartate O-methyltransferase
VTLPPAYFEAMYADSADPWGFASRWYERRKYALTLAALPRERYRRGFEPGASIGVLTALLADRCDSLLATDVAAAAVAAANRAVSAYDWVDVAELAVPHDWPTGGFDLIVLSEIGYYLDADDLEVLLDRSVASLEPGGTLAAVHWRHPVVDYPLRGDDVHDLLGSSPDLHRIVRHEEADLILEVFEASPAMSVAKRSGLLP